MARSPINKAQRQQQLISTGSERVDTAQGDDPPVKRGRKPKEVGDIKSIIKARQAQDVVLHKRREAIDKAVWLFGSRR